MSERPMSPIPVSAAREVADEYGYDQVVIVARRVGTGRAPHGEHCTTYGIDKANCDVAARMGNFFKHKLMGWPEASDDDLAASRREVAALRETRWPSNDRVGRMGEMTPPGKSSIQVAIQSDGDVCVLMANMDDEGFRHCEIEFCSTGAGGGLSPKTRAALIALACAIEDDNAESPTRAWPRVALVEGTTAGERTL